MKFFGGSTTIVREQEQHDYLPLPNFLLCKKQRFNTDELAAMGLPAGFFSRPRKFNHTGPFPDLNTTWQRVTWPMHELDIDWSRYEGRKMHDVNFIQQVK